VLPTPRYVHIRNEATAAVRIRDRQNIGIDPTKFVAGADRRRALTVAAYRELEWFVIRVNSIVSSRLDLLGLTGVPTA
jgi:hypothetical protein